jgi:hypothetical protein
MKRFSILTQALVQAFVITLIISACGSAPQATPTVNLNDRKSTAIAAAVTSLAQTQAAIPTATLVLPTATSNLPPIPTLAPTFTPNPDANLSTPTLVTPPSPVDSCVNQILPASLVGQKIKIRIDNPTKATIMVSVNLQQSGPQSVCGYRSYTLAAGQSLVINNLVEGCYTLWAWNPDPKNYFIVTNGTSCLNISNSWTFDITTNSIQLR